MYSLNWSLLFMSYLHIILWWLWFMHDIFFHGSIIILELWILDLHVQPIKNKICHHLMSHDGIIMTQVSSQVYVYWWYNSAILGTYCTLHVLEKIISHITTNHPTDNITTIIHRSKRIIIIIVYNFTNSFLFISSFFANTFLLGFRSLIFNFLHIFKLLPFLQFGHGRLCFLLHFLFSFSFLNFFHFFFI